MKEKERKRIQVIYFKTNGELYSIEEEYVVGIYNQDEIVHEIRTNKVRYQGLDYVILDGEDGVRPYIKAHLIKGSNMSYKSRGFK